MATEGIPSPLFSVLCQSGLNKANRNSQLSSSIAQWKGLRGSEGLRHKGHREVQTSTQEAATTPRAGEQSKDVLTAGD